uniref:Putative alpha crystallins n=2 Tax=Amblyomma TaxID=6942 RepID=A0A023G698_AMBTT
MLLFPVAPSYPDVFSFAEANPWITNSLPPLASSFLNHMFAEAFVSLQANMCAPEQTCCSEASESREASPEEETAPSDCGMQPADPRACDNNEEPSEASTACAVHSSSPEFTRTLDVSGFAPEEITVKTVGNRLEVYAGHLEKPSSGEETDFVRREYTHRFTLPNDVRPDSVTSTLTKNGTLVVRAPRYGLLTA